VGGLFAPFAVNMLAALPGESAFPFPIKAVNNTADRLMLGLGAPFQK
jgi:hypothetical protein